MTAPTNEKRSAVVSFKKRDGRYRGSISLAHLGLLCDDPAKTLGEVTACYAGALNDIAAWRRDVTAMRKEGLQLSARKAWELGDVVNRLTRGLAERNCRLDGLYDHLRRHAGVSEWLAAFVTFRRYVEDVDAIPEDLKWNGLSKRAKTAGQAISNTRPAENRE